MAEIPKRLGGLLEFGTYGGPYADRQPYPSEREYFQANPSVAGMAAADSRVTLNPYSPLSGAERDAVRQNELARVLMRTDPAFQPGFGLTPEQSQFLSGTTYANASPTDQAATIAARAYSGDPSAGALTPEQSAFSDRLKTYFAVRGTPFGVGR